MKILGAGLAAAALLMLTACGGANDEKPEKPKEKVLQKAYDACVETMTSEKEGLVGEDFYLLESDATRLSVSTPTAGDGTFGSLYGVMAATCVITETDGPQSIATKMTETSALDGEREDSYGDISVTWTFSGGTSGSGLSAYFKDNS